MKVIAKVKNTLDHLKKTLKLKKKTTVIRSSLKLNSVVPTYINPF